VVVINSLVEPCSELVMPHAKMLTQIARLILPMLISEHVHGTPVPYSELSS